jgi:hypothetical protein
MMLTIHDVRSDFANPAANVRMGVPGDNWSRDELEARAMWENSQIKPRQRHAPHYWFLGRALLVVGEGFDATRWKSWRAAHRINRTRCERAQLLARAFGLADEVADLPLLTAVAQACDRLGLEPRQTAADAKFHRRLTAINKTLQSSLDELAAVTAASVLRPLIAEALRKLAALDHACIALDERLHSLGGKQPRPKQPK